MGLKTANWRSRHEGVLEKASGASNEDLAVCPLIFSKIVVTMIMIGEEVGSMRGLGQESFWN